MGLLDKLFGSKRSQDSVKENPDNKDKINEFAELVNACRSGHIKDVDRILKINKSMINYQDKNGYTALNMMALIGKTDIVELLIKSGANLNIKDKNGNTALIYAAGEGHKDTVELLIKSGANLNIQNTDGYNSLMGAAYNGHKNIVELLIKNGIDLNTQDKHGETALIAATINNHRDVVEMFIKSGADLNIQNKNGITALMAAAYRGYKNVTELLIKGEANLDIQDVNGYTALMTVVVSEQRDIVELLIRSGANLNIQNKNGITALMIGAHKGYKDVIDLLIKGGANLEIQDTEGCTALKLAAEEGHKDVVELIKSYQNRSDNVDSKNALMQTENPKPQVTSEEASILVSEAVGIIEAQIQFLPQGFVVKSTGSESEVMGAVHKLEIAHNLQPENEIIRYAYASALHLAMQNKSAEDEMRKCATSHPNFLLAQFAVKGWNNWESPFTLPSWGKEANIITPAISQKVISCILLSTRDYVLPRATLFFRDSGGDFDNLQALRDAKITIATVISPVRNPQVIGIYVKVYDNPSSPYDIENIQVPFLPRGYPTRCRYEYLCLQEDIDLVIINRKDQVILNRRLPFTVQMKETNKKVLDMLNSSDGREINNTELMTALMNHQQQFSPSDVQY